MAPMSGPAEGQAATKGPVKLEKDQGGGGQELLTRSKQTFTRLVPCLEGMDAVTAEADGVLRVGCPLPFRKGWEPGRLRGGQG